MNICDIIREGNLTCLRFSDIDIKKIILLLENGVYPFEYMNEWDKFNETSLPEK